MISRIVEHAPHLKSCAKDYTVWKNSAGAYVQKSFPSAIRSEPLCIDYYQMQAETQTTSGVLALRSADDPAP
jgi:hypothetical protein